MNSRFFLLMTIFGANGWGWAQSFRPPAVPLVVMDPYVSCWSCADCLYDAPTSHWTGAKHPLTGILTVDGKPYRFMGQTDLCPDTVEQKSLIVNATRTVYRFLVGPLDFTVTFTTPSLANDWNTISQPVTYITFDLQAHDGKPHDAVVYFDVQADCTIQNPSQMVRWSRLPAPDMQILQVGSVEQHYLGRQGDRINIDWGNFLLAVPDFNSDSVIEIAENVRREFVAAARLPRRDRNDLPSVVQDSVVMAAIFRFPEVGDVPQSHHLILAYDDVWSVQYMGRNLHPWWRRQGDITPEKMIQEAHWNYPALMTRCRQWDQRLLEQATTAGGPEYAALCALAYRQVLAAHKLTADSDGRPLLFSKEISSNGCMNTVDVAYPTSPFFLLYNPSLLRSLLIPVLDYARSDKWNEPYSPHDIGRYPHANGDVYGEGGMPVEESGNMLIMFTALSAVERNADFARKYWDLLTAWAGYLKQHGLDPANQLCTDDFMGRSAHNANLSIKAILGLACYGKLAGMLGQTEIQREYMNLAKEFAQQWCRLAEDGDHYSLTFDQKGTWSQKYNLVWDRLLRLNVFPPDVAQKEIRYYLARQNQYGLPLDSRGPLTKSDWIFWTACMSDTPVAFQQLIRPVYRFAQETPDRAAMPDGHMTDTAKSKFKARSVVGGYFLKLLADKLAQDAGPAP